MKYVYCLVYDERIFYIGCTTDMRKRYYYHVKILSTTATSKYIQEILNAGQLPDMRIMNYLPLKEAIKLEQVLIDAFTKCGMILTNFQFNWHTGRKYPTRVIGKNLKDMLKLIKYYQSHYKYSYSNNKEDRHWSEYPEYPLNY